MEGNGIIWVRSVKPGRKAVSSGKWAGQVQDEHTQRSDREEMSRRLNIKRRNQTQVQEINNQVKEARDRVKDRKQTI